VKRNARAKARAFCYFWDRGSLAALWPEDGWAGRSSYFGQISHVMLRVFAVEHLGTAEVCWRVLVLSKFG
jgi:hypothetical protein